MPETPALVTTTKGVTLADRLRLSELPLATTPGGRNFCLKALHPSEHTIKSARVPGGNEQSVCIASDQIETFNITASNASVYIQTMPNIVVPCCVHIYQAGHTWVNMYNAGLGGATKTSPTYLDTKAFMANLAGKIAKYRVTSQSVTVELIAPSLTDQGTITAFQGQSPPITTSPATILAAGGLYTSGNGFPDMYFLSELPGTSVALLGTSAYTSKARDGVYMPLKMNSFKWRNFQDRAIYYTAGSASMADEPTPWVISPTNAMTLPFYEGRNNATSWADIPAVPKNCGTTYGRIVINGIAKDVAIRVRVRQVVEIVVPPGTTYAPMVELPLPPDDTSLRMYQEISARMKDGYPASYNDLGTLLDTIKNIGQKVLPYVDPALDFLSKMPGNVGRVATVAKSVKNLAASKAAKAAPAAQGPPPQQKSQPQAPPQGKARKKLTIIRKGQQ